MFFEVDMVFGLYKFGLLLTYYIYSSARRALLRFLFSSSSISCLNFSFLQAFLNILKSLLCPFLLLQALLLNTRLLRVTASRCGLPGVTADPDYHGLPQVLLSSLEFS